MFNSRITISMGYQQVPAASTTTAFSLTVPKTPVPMPQMARIQAEAQALRYRDDGVDPTASVGMLLPVGAALDYDGDINKIRFINAVAGAILNVSYYA